VIRFRRVAPEVTGKMVVRWLVIAILLVILVIWWTKRR